MSFMDRIAAKRDAFRQQKQELLAKQQPKPRYRVRNGKIVLRMYAVLEKKPASNVVQLLPKETKPHAAGNICPHCEGKGIYKWHIGNRQERCFRCHGKGSLNGRDMHYYQLRTQGDRGPICHVVSA